MKVTATIADAEKAREEKHSRERSCSLAQAMRRAGFPRAYVASSYCRPTGHGIGHALTQEAVAFVLLADAYHDDPVALGLPREIEVWAD